MTVTDAAVHQDGNNNQQPAKRTRLDKQADKVNAARAVVDAINREVSDVLEEQRALQNKRAQIAGVLAREGKLTRQQQSELNRVNREIDKLERKVAPIRKRVDKAGQKLGAESDKLAELREAERVKAQAADQKRADKAAAAMQRKFDRKAVPFARIVGKLSTITGDAGLKYTEALQWAKVERVGRGKKAAWQLVVMNRYMVVTVPLTVVGNLRLTQGMVIGTEALRAIEKAGGAFTIEKGGVQPVQAIERHLWVRPNGSVEGYSLQAPCGKVRYYRVEPKGEGYLLGKPSQANLPDGLRPPASPAKSQSLRVAFDPRKLAQVAKALGAEDQQVVIEIDLRQCGKASDGRCVDSGPLRVTPYHRGGATKAGDGVAGVMPVAINK